MITARFRPKFKWVRKSINLINYATAIIEGVKSVAPKAKVIVEKSQFEIIGVFLTDLQKREMGIAIVARDHRLEKYVVEYQYNDGLDVSRQLFIAC
ncbi:MAG: hypothetical protein ACLFPS_09155 [Clostridia bacterium]